MPDSGVSRSVASTFSVVERRQGFDERVILSTDDWVEASTAALTPWPRDVLLRSVRGTHPTHDWDDQRPRRCRCCGGWDNGSYGSKAPCDYDWSHDSLMSALERERACRDERSGQALDRSSRRVGAKAIQDTGGTPLRGQSV